MARKLEASSARAPTSVAVNSVTVAPHMTTADKAAKAAIVGAPALLVPALGWRHSTRNICVSSLEFMKLNSICFN